MIYKKGDLLSVTTGIIAHGCNAQGVMGSGVAKLLRAKYPHCFINYLNDLYREFWLGSVSWSKHFTTPDVAIASCITQEFYGRDPNVRYVSYDAISDAFDDVFREAKKLDWIVNMPKIGAGLGNGDWFIIERLIEESARKANFDTDKIIVWEL
jgi:O-acetyl-ADP-ribose deacetylase (regulator of RNase III)